MAINKRRTVRAELKQFPFKPRVETVADVPAQTIDGTNNKKRETRLAAEAEAKAREAELAQSAQTIQPITNKFGKVGGIALPDGRSFLGLNESEVKALKNKVTERAQLNTPVSFAPQQLGQQTTQSQTPEQTAQTAIAIDTLLNPTGTAQPNTIITPPQSTGETALENAPSIIANAASRAGLFAAGGAGIGSIVPFLGTGAGSAIGAGVGFAVGAFEGFKRVATDEQNKVVTEAYEVYTRSASQHEKAIFDAAQTGQYNPSDIVGAFETNVANVNYALTHLQAIDDTFSGEELNKNHARINEMKAYIASVPQKRQDLAFTIANPDPNKIRGNGEDLRRFSLSQDLNNGTPKELQ